MYRDTLFDIYIKNRVSHKRLYSHADYRSFFNKMIYVVSERYREIRVLDLCEMFDPYIVAYHTRKAKKEAYALFESIFISRVFTVYQFSEIIKEITFKERHCKILIISSVRRLFLGEDIKEKVKQDIFREALLALKENQLSFVFIEEYGNIFYGGRYGKDIVDFYSDNRIDQRELEEFQTCSKKRGSAAF